MTLRSFLIAFALLLAAALSPASWTEPETLVVQEERGERREKGAAKTMVTMHFKDGNHLAVRSAEKVAYEKALWPGGTVSTTQGHGALVCTDTEGKEVARFAAAEVRGYELAPDSGFA